jgi:translocator protein
MKINVKKLTFSVIICQLAGIIGAFFTTPAIDGWYTTLQKPSFNPPGWLFAPVWTTLYLLMAVAVYLVWQSKQGDKKTAMGVFFIQLGLNSFWSIAFFGLKSPWLAMIIIIFLWFLIAKTIVEFFKFSKASAYLLLPYFFWVSFASILNLKIALLN